MAQTIQFACPNCGQPHEVAYMHGGKTMRCPGCANKIPIPQKTTVPVPPTPPTPTQPPPTRVVVVDFNMPFASMVGLMVKWALASIPAALILAFVFGGAWLFLWGLMIHFSGH